MKDCLAFRRRLEALLVGSSRSEGMRELGWHEHLRECADCRELFAAEELLEELLAAWPDPDWSPELRARLLARLAESRADAPLEQLLDLVGADAPRGLSGRVLARVESEREAVAIDRLLDAALAVSVPDGLAARVLTSVRRESAPRRLRRWWGPVAAAAGLTLAIFIWRARDTDSGHNAVVATHVEPDVEPELLAALDVLEDWEFLESLSAEDDLQLATFESFELGDEALLEFLSEDRFEPQEPGEEPEEG